jgi:hypothetical protein
MTHNHFQEITDPCVNRGANPPLIATIVLALCACVSNADGWVDGERYGNAKLDRLRTFFSFKNEIDSP